MKRMIWPARPRVRGKTRRPWRCLVWESPWSRRVHHLHRPRRDILSCDASKDWPYG